MLIKGICKKKELLNTIHDAILSSGSNWTEISSNKNNDFDNSDNSSDGWVFRSPAIGTKKQNIFLRLKSRNFSDENRYNCHIFVGISESYIAGTEEENGKFINKSPLYCIPITDSDNQNHGSEALFRYYIDVKDYRILIVIEFNDITNNTQPRYIYIGYPDLNTNLEGDSYINQFIASSCLGREITNNSDPYMYWLKCPPIGGKEQDGQYNKFAKANSHINSLNPTPMGIYLLNPIYIMADNLGNNIPYTGFLGVLDGIYTVSNTNIVNGDIIKINEGEYKVFNTSNISLGDRKDYDKDEKLSYYKHFYNSIPGCCFAIKIN